MLEADARPDSLVPSTLYLVGTPIGNLEDMTFRSVRTLRQADLIAAEDTRHTGKLLQYFQIETPQLSYHHHNRQQRIPQLLERLKNRAKIALVTDAGMPGISDPGYDLVCACVAADIDVVPVPGVTAVTTGIAVSGLPCDRFIFEGFLPVKNKSRQARIDEIQADLRTVVLYESPHRLKKTLTDLSEKLGRDRAVTLARELTKRYEEFWRGTLGDALEHLEDYPPKGEYTVILGPADAISANDDPVDILQQLQALMAEGVSRTAASRQLAQQTALSKREIYQLSLDHEAEGNGDASNENAADTAD